MKIRENMLSLDRVCDTSGLGQFLSMVDRMTKLKLSIIGCGNVAKTLGYLWHNAAVVEMCDVVNQSQQSAHDSVAFIGAGNPLDSLSGLQAADVFLIGCGDDQLEHCINQLAETGVVKAGNIVFHCSGSKPASIINAEKSAPKWGGVVTASLHPVKSFSSPKEAIKSFANTYCGFEGDEQAVTVLKKWVEVIDGVCFDIDAGEDGKNKLIYHAASVIACNYLVALQELSIHAFAQSGVDREMAMKILEPIVKGTADNIFAMGTANALTGPIARGDYQVVSKQLQAVNDWNTSAGEIYKLLGEISADLSEKQGSAGKENLQKIRDILNAKS
ncbi:Rossmann-like and DUF2520 domain-containing protein [Cocleimonas flava]|nr:Rossmann-like and DUF2520 domain-containing protein [Cocleimonas flava]